MNHWTFVIAAYGVTVLAVAGLVLWAYGSMRRAETAVDKLQQ